MPVSKYLRWLLCFPLYLIPLSTPLLLFSGLLEHFLRFVFVFESRLSVWLLNILSGFALALTWLSPQSAVSWTLEIRGPLGMWASLTGEQNSLSRRLGVSCGFWSFTIHKEKACLRSVPWGCFFYCSSFISLTLSCLLSWFPFLFQHTTQSLFLHIPLLSASCLGFPFRPERVCLHVKFSFDSTVCPTGENGFVTS